MAIDIIKIDVLNESEIDEPLDAQIREFLCRLFPNWESVFKTRRAWHDAPPVFTAIARNERGDIAGHVAVVERTITTNWNFRYLVASVQGVSVDEPYRKTGLSVRLLNVALDEARKRKYPFAILFCREPLVHFYERNGWKLPDDSMIMWRDRELPIHMQSNCPMYRELTDEPFPEGPIDVHNPL
ncbi:MAG: GNAT family N-acetyltransferase [Thermoguttaceae bacterium]|nr:GNAT family N-acetyltransferase [Thermoguttaceae bacterium]